MRRAEFEGRIRKAGDSLAVTVPSWVVTAMALEVGETIKVVVER